MASRPIGEKPVPPAPPSTPTVPSVLAAAPKLTLPSAEDWPLPLPNSPSPEQLPPMPPSWDEEDGQDPREMLVRIAPPGSGGSVASATRPALPSGASSSSLELDSHQPPITEAPQAATSVPRSDPQPIVKLGDELLKAAESDSLESLSPMSPDDPSDLLERRRVVMAGTVIDVDEDQEHEFKAVQVARRPDEQIVDYVEKYANAFLNTKGGIIYFGVEDDGRIAGIPMNRAMRDSLRLRCDQMIQTFRPRVDPTLWSLEFISVERNPHAVKGTGKSPRGGGAHGRDRDRRGRMSKRDEERGGDPMPIMYVVALHVTKGRAPVYFTRAGYAFARNSGSVTRLPDELIEERSQLGRPLAPGKIASVPADLIGRSNEIEQIRKFVHEAQHQSRYVIVVLCGLPMSGKSALARRLASEFSSTFKDLQVTADLKGVRSTHYRSIQDVMLTVIRSVFPRQKIGDDPKEIRGLYDSCFRLRDSILLLENIGSETHIKDMLPAFTSGEGRVLVLATSRKEFTVVQLGVDALVLRLGPLTETDAVALLRSQSPQAHFTDEDAREIVKLCGYLPLPIRIIGASFLQKRISAASVVQLLRDEKRRAQLVESTFEATFELYGDAVRQRVLALSVFRASFDARAAGAVWGVDYASAELALADLLDYSFVDYDSNTLRFSQNDLLRLYCAEQAEKHPDQLRTWRERFVGHYTAYLERFLEAHTLKSSNTDAAALLDVEKANLDALQSYAKALSKPELETRLSALFSKLCTLLDGCERVSLTTLVTHAHVPTPQPVRANQKPAP